MCIRDRYQRRVHGIITTKSLILAQDERQRQAQHMQVEGQHGQQYLVATGARVSNAYATCLYLEDSPWKRGLILHNIYESHGLYIKTQVDTDGHACHQLDGEVTAHHDIDGQGFCKEDPPHWY
eukprot:TRINITY_DN2621_c0_g1_i5.p2 TRINITY_DN2621_c0_g1~~TRINITY_DN2621_c0_g1_i5.p2  ORF type:complete len:123 (+),score=0.38 TRINITY_DN2621_c0_g1_i5:140-508(+)